MCGSSQSQQQIAGQEQTFSSLLDSNYQKNFGAQSQVLQNLNNIYTPIAEAGPDQQGFGTNELAALNTQAEEGVSQNYSKASQALNTQLSAEGGGNEFLPTGAKSVLKGSLASAAANEQSQAQLGITEANYNQGRQNWQQATSGLNALSGDYNPNAAATEATGANSDAFSSATQNAMQGYQQFDDVASGIESLMKGGAAVAGAIEGA